MTSFDFDVIGDTPRLVSRPPDVGKPATEIPEQPPAAPAKAMPTLEPVSALLEKRRA